MSLFLHQNLHGLFESVHKSHIPDLYAWTKELGGYFKRFRGGVLAPWLGKATTGTAGTQLATSDLSNSGPELDLEARATMAFLEVCSDESRFRTISHVKSGGQNCQRR